MGDAAAGAGNGTGGLLYRAARSVKRLFAPPPRVVYVDRPRPACGLSQGSVRPDEIELVRRLVERANGIDGPVVEVGTLFGLTTRKIAAWKRPGKLLLTVDNFGWNPLELTPAQHRELTAEMLAPLTERGEVEIRVQGKDEFFAAYAGPPPALVFLDAIHTYEETLKDIRGAQRVGARLIAGHDYSDEFPGVQRAVREAGGPAELVGTVWALPPAV